jgi:alkylation response protein AidB-like acyl-CoA dehydrogenase
MFSFAMSKEQKMVKDEFARFVKEIVIDAAHDMDEDGKIPDDVIQRVWELGASISMIPEEYGGFGMKDSPMETTLILEELAYGDMSFAIAATLPSLFIHPVSEMGTEAQKKKYLPLYCGETYSPCTFALHEPHYGFDPLDLKTTAARKNGSYVLNGKKCFVPLAKLSKHLLVAAAYEGVNNLFIVERENSGVTVSEKEPNLGLNALETNEVILDNCEIPAEDRLGGDNGCDFDRLLQKMRIAISAMGTGISRASLEFAKNYALERVQFGEPIVFRQSIAFMLAEMAYEVDAMRLMTWKAASRLEAGKDAKRESYLAKLYAGEMAMKVTDHGVQVLGGHGYIRDYPQERYYRNGRGISILEAVTIL